MFENKIPTIGEARQPRALVTINGINAQYIKIEVDSTSYFLADTFNIELPISGQDAQLNENYFSSTNAIMVEIFIGFPADPDKFTSSDLESFILGQVDQIDTNYSERIYSLSGRDLTAKFIDNKTTDKFPNLTASEIVEQIAKKEGLKYSGVPTKIPSGVFYSNNHVTLSNILPEWDLITFLAQSSGYIAFVKGLTLYFIPEPSETEKPYLMQFNQPNEDVGYTQFVGTKLNLTRRLTVARDIIVIVRSWHSGLKKSFTAIAKATPTKKDTLASKAKPIGDVQKFVYNIAGLTREQALIKAQNILKQLSRHERNIDADLAGSNDIKREGILKLSGTQTSYDQLYRIASINRTFSQEGGYKMNIIAKNHSPNSEVSI